MSDKHPKEKVEGGWMGRNLTNYKAMHEKTAKSKDVYAEFQNAKTITQAKKILFGYKRKNAK